MLKRQEFDQSGAGQASETANLELTAHPLAQALYFKIIYFLAAGLQPAAALGTAFVAPGTSQIFSIFYCSAELNILYS